MKSFEGHNYYEILKIPFNAGLEQIQSAYRAALDIYEENSLVTYTLFSDEQRSDLLQAIDEAFHTLSHEQKRAAYNQMLMETGQAEAAAFTPAIEPPKSAKKETATLQHRDLRTWVRKKSEEKEITQLAQEIAGKDLVSGDDLRKLREVLSIELDEIFIHTRISGASLRMIEQNQYADLPAEIFLKSFLKSYAEILQIDPRRIIDGYLKLMALAKAPKKGR